MNTRGPWGSAAADVGGVGTGEGAAVGAPVGGDGTYAGTNVFRHEDNKLIVSATSDGSKITNSSNLRLLTARSGLLMQIKTHTLVEKSDV